MTDPQLPNLILTLPQGDVVIELMPEIAPNHVARMLELTAEGFYDGLPFHRVINNIAQAGDTTGDGMGVTGKKLEAEFTGLPLFERGIVATARGPDENSGDSQFFIVRDRRPDLDGKYTIWGHVITGMEFIDALPDGKLSREQNYSGEIKTVEGYVENPVRIIRFGAPAAQSLANISLADLAADMKPGAGGGPPTL